MARRTEELGVYWTTVRCEFQTERHCYAEAPMTYQTKLLIGSVVVTLLLMYAFAPGLFPG